MRGQQNFKQGDVLRIIKQVQQKYDVLRLKSTQLLRYTMMHIYWAKAYVPQFKLKVLLVDRIKITAKENKRTQYTFMFCEKNTEKSQIKRTIIFKFF